MQLSAKVTITLVNPDETFEEEMPVAVPPDTDPAVLSQAKRQTLIKIAKMFEAMGCLKFGSSGEVLDYIPPARIRNIRVEYKDILLANNFDAQAAARQSGLVH